jgi:hypothetical protein
MEVVSVPVSPDESGNFSNGIWSGTVAVLQPASNLILRASMGAGCSGQSRPFDVLGTPRLAFEAAGNAIVLSWPLAAAGFTLEQTHLLSAPPIWTPVPDAPVVAGDRHIVTNTSRATNTFYRLSKP